MIQYRKITNYFAITGQYVLNKVHMLNTSLLVGVLVLCIAMLVYASGIYAIYNGTVANNNMVLYIMFTLSINIATVAASLIFHGLKPGKFNAACEHICDSLGDIHSDVDKGISLLGTFSLWSIGSLFIAVICMIYAIIVNKIGATGSIVLYLVSALVWIVLSGGFKRGISLAVILSLLPVLFIAYGMVMQAALLNAAYTGTLLVFYIMNLVKKVKFWNGSIAILKHIDATQRVARKIQAKTLTVSEQRNYQALVITIITYIFIIGPRIIPYAPDYILEITSGYLRYAVLYKPYAIYASIGLFAMFIGTQYLHGIQEITIPKDSDKGKTKADKWAERVIFMVIYTLPIMAIIMIITYNIMKYGHDKLGSDYALIIGYFVFPNIFNKVFSYLSAVIALMYMQPSNEKSNRDVVENETPTTA